MNKSKKRSFLNLLTVIVLLFANWIFLLTIWMSSKYDHVTLDQFIYQAKTSAAGANRSLVNSAAVRVGLFGILLTAGEVLFFLFCSGSFRERFAKYGWYSKFRAGGFCRFLTKRVLPIVLVILLLSTVFFSIELDLFHYVRAVTTESDFIEKHYVNPNDVTLTFPEQKRNLIYIFVESMEVTFSDPAAGGPIYENYIPELTALAEENINFSTTSGVGGALPFEGTTWTAAAMVAQTSGVIVQVPLTAENYGGENEYIPGLVSIGQVLEQNGYRQTLLLGSDAEFAGCSSYFTEHGGFEILDIQSLKQQGRLPQDYLEWWGFEDEKLFSFAKEELTRLSETGEPFNLTMFTADTHFPNGYVCGLCQTEYSTQYPNVLRCSSRQLADFVSWVKQQPFYENTTIVISGDHLTMDPDFLEDMNESYQRTIYNCIINPSVSPVKEKERQFGTFDLFPTTLAAMGVQIEGDRLGLGTNLFSAEQTLTEEFGYEELDYELQKNSEFYNTTFLKMEVAK